MQRAWRWCAELIPISMEKIQRSDGQRIAPMKDLPEDRIWTVESDGGIWAAKRPDWLGFPAALFGIRQGTEMFYYALAKHNKLPMPESRIVTVGGINCWATEYLPTRKALGTVNEPLTPAAHAKLSKTLKTDAAQREAYLRALFLDVMLRNTDRKVANILKTDAGEAYSLYFFDHEQSLGWRGNIQAFGRNRIKSSQEEYAEIDASMPLERMYRWASSYSTFSERRSVFESLDLQLSLLDELEPQIPRVFSDNPHHVWIFPDQFKDMRSGLAAWWKYILRMPYAALDSRLFSNAVVFRSAGL